MPYMRYASFAPEKTHDEIVDLRSWHDGDDHTFYVSGESPLKYFDLIETPPTTADPMDDEFDDESFDTGLWSVLGTNGETITEISNKRLNVAYNANENRYRGIYQAAPASGDFTIEAKLYNPVGFDINARSGIWLSVGASTTGHQACVGIWQAQDVRGIAFSTPSSSAAGWGSTYTYGLQKTIYVRLTWTAVGTTVTAYVSLNGEDWTQVATNGATGWTQANMIVGLGWTNNRNYEIDFQYGWFRRTA